MQTMSAIPEQNLSYLTLFSADDSPRANVVVANYPTSDLNLNFIKLYCDS